MAVDNACQPCWDKFMEGFWDFLDGKKLVRETEIALDIEPS
jgi:hypothetical protein